MPAIKDSPKKKRRPAWPPLVFLAVEALFLGATAAIFIAFFPSHTGELWLALIGAGLLGALANEAIRGTVQRLRRRSYINRFDLREEIRNLSGEVDEVDRSLRSEEILDEFIDLGRRLLRNGKWPEAIEHFSRAIELDPHQSRLYNYLGITLGRADRHAEAVEAYLKAIAIDYDYTVAHFNLALAYEQLDRSSDALDEWSRFVEVGELVGEHDDKLQLARDRIRELKERLSA